LGSALRESILGAALSGIESDQDGWLKKRFSFDKTFLGFQGHFPGYPVLPAFVQVLMAVVSIEEMSAARLEVSAMDNAKFQREIHPEAQITVEWQSWGNGPFMFRVRLRLNNMNQTAASFVITCKEKQGPAT
jgi:3-hydroxyacyl-[acyl-carrier-protein] dehydratase